MAELRFAGILGTGHYAPEKILSNADLEKMVDPDADRDRNEAHCFCIRNHIGSLRKSS